MKAPELALETLAGLPCIHQGADFLIYHQADSAYGKPVVIKIPRRDQPTPLQIRRLANEYRLTAGLDIPGVRRVCGELRAGGRPALVLEFFPGTTLREAFVQERRSLAENIEIAIAIATVLEGLHQHNLIHLNLSSRNILVQPDAPPAVMLIDFGDASLIGGDGWAPEATELCESSLAYVSPEQTGRSRQPVDQRADLYSFGALLYEVFTGQLPFATSDAAELVHCHLAQNPQPPQEVNSEVPGAVSDIVMRLMAKNAEERYQSAFGVRSDLKHCLAQLRQNGRIETFQLGLTDRRSTLRLAEKLYGREREIGELIAAFERTMNGGGELVLVTGYAGVGKTALVHEMRRRIADSQGHFIEGKFDQLKRNVPYSGWIHAFTGFVNRVLTEGEAQLAQRRSRILQAVGSLGRVMTDVIPNLELVIGDQPDVPVLNASETQNRFNYVFLKLVKAIATREHPLVVFLDDLQWIDAASLKLLQTLLEPRGVSCILVIGAYRSNDVDTLHPLTKGLEALRREGAKIELLNIQEFPEETVNELVASSLRDEPWRTAPMARLLYSRTRGNPFFLLQTLRALVDRRALTFAPKEQRWQWDIAALEGMEITSNVVTLMLGKIQQLPPQTQRLLPLAACIGVRFAIADLSAVAGQSQWVTLQGLQPALSEGLIVAGADYYQFVHDRVREAAYSIIPAAELPAQHLQIGRRLLAQTRDDALAETIFEIVSHLNEGRALITAPAERERLAGLNLAAGRRAKAAGAFALAVDLLTTGAALAGANAWETNYDLVSALLLEQGECEYLAGNYERSDALLAEALQKVNSLLDKARVHRLRQRLYQLSGRYVEATAAALEALRLFGISLPDADDDIRASFEAENQQVGVNLRGRSIASLASVPLTDDAEVRALIGLLAEASPLVYTARPLLWPLITAKGVNLSLQGGHADESPFIYSCYSMVLVGVCHDIPAALQFSEMALELSERLPGAAAWRGKVMFHDGAVVGIWGRHFAEKLPLLDLAFQACLSSGDLVHAGYLTYNAIWLHLEKGDPLEQVAGHARRYAGFARQAHNDVIHNMDRMEEQFVLCLQGKTRSLTDFSDDAFSEADCVAVIGRSGFGLGTAYHHIMKLMAAYLAGEYDEALAWAGRASPMLLQVASMANEVTYHFFHALTLAALYRQAPAEQQQEFAGTLKDIQGKLTFWADHCPENFANRRALISAEIARIEERDQDAMRLYEEAIASARENGYVQNEAIAYEVAATFYGQRGYEKIARTYLAEAAARFAQWGATGKLQQLERLNPWLAQSKQPGNATLVERLDTSAVAKAQLAISGEIRMDRLVQTLLRIVMENAGAQTGCLRLEGGGTLRAVLEQGDDRARQIIFDTSPVATNIPEAIFNYVRRARQAVILKDASVDAGEFSGDEYLSRVKPRSVLCMAIQRKDQLLAVLYLENRLAANVFTTDRLELLEALASQAAISMENASLYADLEGKIAALSQAESELRQYRDFLEQQVQARTAELRLALDAAEAANKAKSVFLANMSHELRTPLNAILGFSSMMRREPRLSEGQSENLDIINRSGEHLLTLINDVLEMAKIEAGRLQLEIAPFDLRGMVRDVADMMRQRAQEKGLVLLFDQTPEFPRCIKGDEGRLRQVLVNLVGNAVKFTSQGGVTIRLSVRPDALRPLMMEVEDTGPGIALEDQKRLFQPFVQLAEAGKQKGTGLGLAISHQFVQLMGGTIEVTSAVGKGSVFRVALPVELADETGIGVPRGSAQNAEVAGLVPGQPACRILIAEDDRDNQQLLTKLMTRLGLDVKVADNGEQCVKLFQEWRPQLVWMDRRMPVMDGVEATRRIRALPGGQEVKIVAVTASVFQEQRQKLLDARMDDFVRKPYRFHEIYNCMAKHLGIKYVYRSASPARTETTSVALAPAMLAVLPAATRHELESALKSLDSERIKAVLQQAGEADAELGRTLTRLAENFNYPAILDALASENAPIGDGK